MTTQGASPTSYRAGGTRPGLVVWAATATMSMLVLDSSIVGTMLPSISDDLALSPAGTTWVVASYLLALAVALPLAGRVVDRVGPGRAFVLGSIGFVMASAGIACAGSGATIIGWRVAAGVAAAVLMPAATTLITATYRSADRTRMMAIYIGVGQSFSLVGPAVGGLCAQFLSWRYGFLINVPFGIAAIVAVRAAGVGAYRTAASVGVGAIANTRLWTRAFTLSSVVLAGLGFSMTIATVYGAAEVQRMLDLSPFAAGLAIMPLVVALLLTTRWVTAHAHTIVSRTIGIVGAALMVVGFAVTAVGFGVDSLTLICAGMLPIGTGIGLLMAPMTANALAEHPVDRHGFASAVSTTGRQLGSAAGALAYGAVSTAFGGPAGFATAALVMAGCVLATVLLPAHGPGEQ